MSYMDRKNILSEGIIDKLLMKMFKLDKKALKDPEIKKAIKKFDKSSDEFRDLLNKARVKSGLKPLK